tara:strand:+ start:224 stop:421 length:198 start_codon:yes stop_codon:yes gene_type:complete
MKRAAIILIFLIILSIPLVFFNKGNELLTEKGYTAEATEKVEVFLIKDKQFSDEFDSVEVIQVYS